MDRVVVANQSQAAHTIAHGMERALASGMKVLWLLSGGSNVAVELETLSQLHSATPENLTIGLIDERYVPLDSPDGNWNKLLAAGLTGEKATLMPLLEGLPLEETAVNYASKIVEASKDINVVIGQFGIGPDGHTAGILPRSPAVHEKKRLVVGYNGPDFQRITTTQAFFRQMDLAIAVALGPDKREPLQRLSP